MSPRGGADRWIALGLLVLALAALVGWRALLGLWGAQGTDAPLWGLSAAALATGAPSAVPPLWPALVALLHGGLGLALVPAGWGVAMAAAALVPPTAYALARRAGATPRAGALVGALLCVHPELLAWGNEVHANSATALGLALVAAAWAGRGPRAAVAAALLAGLLPLVRETGVVVALAGALLAPLAWRRGGALALLLVAAWWLSPLLVGAAPGPTPLDTPWGARGGMALAGLDPGDGALPNYVAEIAPAQRDEYVRWLRQGEVAQVALFHARRSLSLAWDGWLVAAAAAVGALGLAWARRPARLDLAGLRSLLLPLRPTLLVLATLAPALVVWTQRRHVLLAAPALLALAAAALAPAAGPRPARGLRLLGLGLLLASLGTWPARWGTLADDHRGETRRARALAELAAQVAAARPPLRLLGGPVQDVGLYLPLPRHDLDGSAADDHTALIVPARLERGLVPPGWEPLGPPVAETTAWRAPPGPARRCPDGVPVPGSATLSAGPTHARLRGCPEEP